jgi:hypothetical protein
VDFDRRFMGWADAHGVGYLAWGWWELSPDPGTTSCSSLPYSGSEEYALIDDSGHPVAPDGTNLYDHLRTLAASRAGGG